MTNKEILALAGGDARRAKIIQTIIECQRFSKLIDFVKVWESVIADFEDKAFKRGIKQAEKILGKETRN